MKYTVTTSFLGLDNLIELKCMRSVKTKDAVMPQAEGLQNVP